VYSSLQLSSTPLHSSSAMPAIGVSVFTQPTKSTQASTVHGSLSLQSCTTEVTGFEACGWTPPPVETAASRTRSPGAPDTVAV